MSKLAEAIKVELIRQMEEQGGYYAHIPEVNPVGLAVDGVIYFHDLVEMLEEHFRREYQCG